MFEARPEIQIQKAAAKNPSSRHKDGGKSMNGNELAARFIGDTRWDGLPDAVKHKVKMCLVDNIAAIVGGVLTPLSDVAAAYAPVAWPGGHARHR